MSEEINQMDFRMTDLEEVLSSDDGKKVQTEALDRLGRRGVQIKTVMDAGLQPEEYAKAEIAYKALAAAHEIISHFPVPETKEK